MPAPLEGHPYGWYHLSVTVPPWYSAQSGRPYIWIGLFCSADCLGNGIARIQAEEQLTLHAYAHE